MHSQRLSLKAAEVGAGATVRIKPVLQNQKPDSELLVSLGHIYEYVEDGGTESLPKVAGRNSQTPEDLTVLANYPNPFNPSTSIRYQLAETGPVSVTIYNLVGQKVRTLVEAVQSAGPHEVTWNGRDDAGRQAASGIYIYSVQAGKKVAVNKMVLVK